MKNNKILISFLLILLVALCATAVSASDVDDVVASDDGDVLAVDTPTTKTVDGNDDVAIQKAIDNVSAGSTVDLGENKVYTINSTIKVEKNITISGKNITFNAEAQTKSGSDSNPGSLYSGLINVVKAGSGSSISGIKFVNVNANKNYTYANTLKGYGIQFSGGASNCLVDGCSFYDFNNGVYISSSSGNTIINSYFTGVSTLINNNPGGAKDRGSYAISIMSSGGTLIFNNTFYGPLCDGVSIAGGSGGNNRVLNNTFEGNAYSIYFGGASTAGSLIANNTFINCGSFSAIRTDNNQWDNWTDLPVISIQKSADNIKIMGNTFKANTGNILIGANEANTAHGYPSNIGDIYVTDNVVEKNGDAVMSTVVLLNIISESGILNPTGAIVVTNNTLNGAKSAAYWSYDWAKTNMSDVNIKAADPATTYIQIVSNDADSIVAILKDVNNNGVDKAVITYSNNGVNGTVTAVNGTFTISNPKGLISMNYAGSSKLAPSSAVVNYTFATSTTPDTPVTPVVPVVAKTTALTTPTKTYKVKATKKLAITLKASGKPVSGKKITVKVNGKTYSAKTNAKGVATVTVKITKKGTFKYTASFAGDKNYKSISKKGTIKVKK